MLNEIKKDAQARMGKSIDALRHTLIKLRTGRASAAIVDHLKVNYYGSEVPQSQVASVAVTDASTITGLVNRLESAGLVERSRPAGDRRTVMVTATEASADLQASLHRVAGCVADAMKMDPDAAHSLISTLHDLRENLTSADRPSLRSA